MRTILLPSLAALLIQPVVFVALTLGPALAMGRWGPLYGFWSTIALVEVFAAAHLFVLGIPAFLLLRGRGRVTAGTMAAAGFLCGLPFILIAGWPSHYASGVSAGGTWHGQYRETLVNGVPTVWAWLSYLEGLVFFGIQGTAGGLAFYWAWRKLRPNNAFKPILLRRQAPTGEQP